MLHYIILYYMNIHLLYSGVFNRTVLMNTGNVISNTVTTHSLGVFGS